MNILGVLLLVVLTSLLIAGGLSRSRFRLAEHERLAVFRLGHLVDMRGPGVVWILPYLDSGVKLDAEDAFEARRIADYRAKLSEPADRPGVPSSSGLAGPVYRGDARAGSRG